MERCLSSGNPFPSTVTRAPCPVPGNLTPIVANMVANIVNNTTDVWICVNGTPIQKVSYGAGETGIKIGFGPIPVNQGDDVSFMIDCSLSGVGSVIVNASSLLV